ncbi:hypothetical protein [Motiliproteus sediminis]|uniref:hypothetical protein n=1 Tax=Motiliproteus sediminis TaxID=1468178 RepID=UPI001AEF3C3A|nr:hypothetical protein [Motiliproteus sediminis]
MNAIIPTAGILLWILALPANAADPAERAARLNSSLDFESGRIVLIQADADKGVWALTRNGKLYHCQRISAPQGERLHCIGREGEVMGDY